MKKYDSYKPILKNWLYGIAFYFIPFIIGYLAFSFVLSDNVLHTDVDSARYMLSALIQSEAAIVALVVTLSLVAVQLAAQSYSARVIEVFRKAPDLWILMGIYGVAIFYGLGVLKQIENPLVGRQSNLEGHIAFSYYLGVFAFVALVPYILKMFEMLKPSMVINMLAEGITKDSLVIPEAVSEKDPIQPIVDIVRGALMKYDYETIRDGLMAIGKRTKDMIEDDTFKDREEALEHIFSHFIRIGNLAASKEDDGAAREVIALLYENGLMTMKHGLHNSTLIALNGIRKVGMSAGTKKLERTTHKSVEAFGEILKISAAKQEFIIGSVAFEGLKLIKKLAEEQKFKGTIDLAKYYLESIEANNTVQEFINMLVEKSKLSIKEKKEFFEN